MGGDNRRVEVDMFGGNGDPAPTEGLPPKLLHRGRAEQRTQRRFGGASVRSGNDAEAVGVGQLQHLAHQVDAILEARLADLRAMRTAERFGGNFFGGPARRLRAGTGRESGARRAHLRLRGVSHKTLLTESTRGVGTARSEKRRVGKRCASKCKYRWAPVP